MKAIIHMEIRKNLQDKGLLFWMILLPIIFTVLFITIFTSGIDDSVKGKIIASIVPGYVVMFVFFIMITMVSTFLKDKNAGMTARLASTPLSPLQYLIGKWIPHMYVVCIQMIVLFLFGKIVYDIPFQQPLLLLILAIILAYTVTGIGLALALFAKTENMGLAVTQLIALGGAMLGGLWMPLDTMPSFLQLLAKFLPQYWAHQSFQDAMTGTLTYGDFLLASLVLLGFGTIGLIIALVQYPRFLKQARN